MKCIIENVKKNIDKFTRNKLIRNKYIFHEMECGWVSYSVIIVVGLYHKFLVYVVSFLWIKNTIKINNCHCLLELKLICYEKTMKH